MATYSIDQIIGAAKGLKNWYDYWVSGWKLVKTLQGEVSILEAGGTPAFGAAIDTRYAMLDTASSGTTYTAITAPAASGSDTIPTHWYRYFIPNTTNTGAATLNIGSSEGAVAINKYVDGSKADLEPGDLKADVPIIFVFDGTHFVALIHSGGGATSPSRFIY
jgi:hypothetical protein